MKNSFLKIKHWQLFLLLNGPIFIGFIGMMFLLPYNEEIGFTFIISLTAIFKYLVFIFWMKDIVIGFTDTMSENLKTDTFKFKIFFGLNLFIAFTYTLTLFNVFAFILNHPFISITLNSLFLISLLYCFLKAGKVYKTVEQQKEVSFSEYFGFLFHLVFFDFSLWYLQPRINKLFKAIQKDQYKPIKTFI